MSAKRSQWLVRLSGLVCLLLVLAVIYNVLSARLAYQDIKADVLLEAELFPAGDYFDVAWLSETQIAFLYVPPELYRSSRLPHLDELHLILYDLDSRTWSAGPLPDSAGCYAAGIEQIARLPSGQLGFHWRCNSLDSQLSGTTLYQWAPASGRFEPLHFFGAPFFAAQYAFSPDMAQVLQENAVGNGLNNQIYRVELDRAAEQFLPDWQRVASPSWSPDGQTIAFVGTESYRPGTPQSFDEVVALARAAKTLYLMDGTEGAPRPVLKDVDISRLRWFPDSVALAFLGNYKSTSGIWVMRIDPQTLTRIWPIAHVFDLSPDGKKAIILQRVDFEDGPYNRPIVVAVPSILSSGTNP